MVTVATTREPVVVLVAEDEVLIRMLAVDVLIDAGFCVVEAEHAAQALNVLEARMADIRVLCTDHHMPGAMKGLQLVHHVRQHWPHIGLLLTSGHPAIAQAQLPEGCRFLLKPYFVDHLVAHIKEMSAAFFRARADRR